MISAFNLKPGNVVRVHQRIKETESAAKGAKEKTRIQVFEGVVIKIKGSGENKSFTVRKISSGIGVERIFPVDSPNIEKVEVKGSLKTKVRRAKLYHLRDLKRKIK